MNKKNIVVIGTGNFAKQCAQICINHKYSVQIFEYGAFEISLLERMCNKELIYYKRVKKEELTALLRDIAIDSLIISANSTYIIPKDILEKDNIEAINFHPALLPKHPGRNAEAWAIFEQDSKSGITWHIIDEKIDHGDIINQREISIDNDMTSLKLMQRQFQEGIKGFQELMNALDENDLMEMSHCINTVNEKDIKYSKEIPNSGELDLSWSIEKKYAFLRAMDYGKLKVLGDAYCIIDKHKYIIDDYLYKDNEGCCKEDIKNGYFTNGNKDLILKLC